MVAAIRDEIRARQWDLLADAAKIRSRLAEMVATAGNTGAADSADVLTSAWEAIAPFGSLQPLLDDESVEELWINGDDRVFISRGGRSELTSIVLSQPELSSIVERMIRHSGRRIDVRNPFVDATLPDGSRVHAVIPPITAGAISLNVRKFPRRAYTLEDLETQGVMLADQLAFVRSSLARGDSIVVSGATNSGKTTMVRALLGELDFSARIITCEEVFELAPTSVDVVCLQTRAATLEGGGEVSLRRLVVEALRMRPDVIVVGEVRQAEAFELLIALNSGVRGFCTIHANSAEQALRKLSTLPLLAGSNVSPEFVTPAIADCVDVVIHMSRSVDGARSVAQILEVTGHRGAVIQASTVTDVGRRRAA